MVALVGALSLAVILASLALKDRPDPDLAARRALWNASSEPESAGAQSLYRALGQTSDELADRLKAAPLFRELQVLGGDPAAVMAAPAGSGPVQEPVGFSRMGDGSLVTPRQTVFELRAVLTSGLERIERAQAETAARQSAANASAPDPLASLAAARPTAWPLRGPITDRYGWRILFGARDFHTGIDIAANMGTPIRATKAGKVVWVGWRGGLGGAVEIQHEQGFSTVYAHMSYYGTELGRQVQEGEVIGYVGSTGYSTGPHLHYEIRRFGVPVNPDDYLR
jgi:murein DD-endopeptidase MepM/ murein hydrolase activator NlpD